MKKLLCLIIAAALISAELVSCAEKASGDEATGSAAEETASSAETEYKLPDADFEGYKFSVLWPSKLASGHFTNNEIYSETEDGDTIHDAVYKRNLAVEEKYNISISGPEDQYDSIPKTIKNMTAAGDCDYDAFCTQIAQISPLALEGSLYNWKDFENFKEDMPWWNVSLMSELSLGDQMFLGTGDIIYSDDFYPYIVLFNKKLIADYSLEDPYSLVFSGSWTIDKMLGMASVSTGDLNGDGVYTYDDQFGIVAVNSGAKAFFTGCGGHIVAKSPDGSLYLDMKNDKTQSILEKILAVYYTGNLTYNGNTKQMNGLDHAQTTEAIFSQGRSLFLVASLITVERLRDSEADFGILPIPKYDDAQERYYCILNDMTLLGVPFTAPDTNRTSLILSAMGKESQSTLTGAFYEKVLSQKYFRDEESIKMLDLILDSEVTPDPGILYDFGTLNSGFVSLVASNKSDFASFYAQNESKANKALEDYIEIIGNM